MYNVWEFFFWYILKLAILLFYSFYDMPILLTVNLTRSGVIGRISFLLILSFLERLMCNSRYKHYRKKVEFSHYSLNQGRQGIVILQKRSHHITITDPLVQYNRIFYIPVDWDFFNLTWRLTWIINVYKSMISYIK